MGSLHRFPGFARRSLASRASDDLSAIRATMERAVSFTAVPGWGAVLMGSTACLAAWSARQAADDARWLVTWLVAATIAGATGFVDLARKASARRSSLLTGAGWRFLRALLPGFATGALLTLVLARAGLYHELAGTWLLCYGTGVAAAGVHSLPAVRWLGRAFLPLGALALFVPLGRGDVWLALGFGALHVAFGWHVARRSDG